MRLRYFQGKSILNYPRLDTVLMVEYFIQDHNGEYKKRKLWESLPKQMRYQTFCTIVDYLIYSNKVSIDAEGKIGWIYNPEAVKKSLEKRDLFWRKK